MSTKEKVSTGWVLFVIVPFMTERGMKIPLVMDKGKPEPRLWKLPGGCKDLADQSPEDTFFRELDEELSKREGAPSLNPFVPDVPVFSEPVFGSGHRFIVVEAQRIPVPSNVRLEEVFEPGEEIEKIHFFSPEELHNLIKDQAILDPTLINNDSRKPSHAGIVYDWLVANGYSLGYEW